jgi:hypothetical protein
MALGSTARLAEDDCPLAPGSVNDIRLPTKMGFSIACPNLLSRNPHPVTLHLAKCAALLMALGSTARLVGDVPNLPFRNPHAVTVQSAEGAALLTALGLTARLAEDGCLLAPGSADDISLPTEMGLSIACPDLPFRDPHAVTVQSAEGAALLTALGSTARLAEHGCALAPESADDIHLASSRTTTNG